jgi:Hint domain
MSAERITVGIYALDKVLLPKRPAGKGWLPSLADSLPVLQAGAITLDLTLLVYPDGFLLAGPATIGGVSHTAGAKVSIDPVPGQAALFLVRIGSRPCGLASAVDWPPGTMAASMPAPVSPTALAALVAGTRVETPDGPRPAEKLVAGDLVSTLANGSQPLKWVGRRQVTPVELAAHPGLRPVTFAPGAAGHAGELSVSPMQRMLIDDWRAEVYFGEDRVLVSAQALVDNTSVRTTLPERGFDYVILLCNRHEVLLAEGALVESFHPGETGLDALPADLRSEVAAVVPETELIRRRAAFPIVRSAEARALRTS